MNRLLSDGIMPFEPLVGPEARAWYQWLLLNRVLFSPWIIVRDSLSVPQRGKHLSKVTISVSMTP